MSQASCFAAAYLYVEFDVGMVGNIPLGDEPFAVEVEAREEGGGFPPSAVMTVIQVAFVLWLVSLVGFFTSIDKAYLHTFFDIASAKQHAVREFRNATNAFEKLQVFGYHKSYYASIMP